MLNGFFSHIFELLGQSWEYKVNLPATTPDHRTVGIVLCDNVLATSATLPYEMMATAEASAQVKRLEGTLVKTLYISADGQPVASASGFRLSPDCSLADCPQLDLVHFPGQWRNPRRAIRDEPGAAPPTRGRTPGRQRGRSGQSPRQEVAR